MSETLKEAYEFLNGDPDNRVREFLLANEVSIEDEEDGDEEMEIEYHEMPIHSDIHLDLNRIFVNELYKIRSEIQKKSKRSLSEYQASNINYEPVPLQYLPFSSIPDDEKYKPLLQSNDFSEIQPEEIDSFDFQAIRVRDEWGKMFIAFRKFTRSQIVGSSWRVKLALANGEFDRYESNLFALPQNFDAFFFDDTLFVDNQGKFEDIFNYFKEYEKNVQNVFDELENHGISIHNKDFVEEALLGDRYALRKMAAINKQKTYTSLSQDDIVKQISDYDLDVEVKTHGDDWSLVVPNKGDKDDLLKILNEDNVIAEASNNRYQAVGKREIN